MVPIALPAGKGGEGYTVQAIHRKAEMDREQIPGRLGRETVQTDFFPSMQTGIGFFCPPLAVRSEKPVMDGKDEEHRVCILLMVRKPILLSFHGIKKNIFQSSL